MTGSHAPDGDSDSTSAGAHDITSMADGATATKAGPRARAQHRLGHSQVQVSGLSLGTAPLGGLFSHVADEVAAQVVQAALDAGLTYLDTAPHYGRGVAERRVGAGVAGRNRSSFVLSTKVGRLVVPADGQDDNDTAEFADAGPSKVVFDFSADGIRRSLEESLERLGLDRVDIAYIHDPDDYADEAISQAYPALHELREQGVVGAIGLGMNQSAVPARFVRETDIDAVLLAGRYTLLDQSGQADLLPLAAERGVSIVIGGVYNSGLLADPRPGATFNYVQAPPELLDKARRIGEIAAARGVSLQAAAIQFPLAHPAVATVLTGCRSVDELAQNMAAFEVVLPGGLWTDLLDAGLLPASEAAMRV